MMNNKYSRAEIVVVVLFLVCICSMAIGIYKLVKGNTGSPCAVEVQFKDSKATYIGSSI
jgi:hypothetical protein